MYAPKTLAAALGAQLAAEVRRQTIEEARRQAIGDEVLALGVGHEGAWHGLARGTSSTDVRLSLAREIWARWRQIAADDDS